MRVPATPDDDGHSEDYDDCDFDNDPITDKLLEIAVTGAEAEHNLTLLKTSLAGRSKALERAAAFRRQASRPRQTEALSTAMAKLSSSQQSEAVRKQLERMQMRYAEPENADAERGAQQADDAAEKARAAAKSALRDFETAKARIVKLEKELARMQQPDADEETNDGTEADDEEEREVKVEKMVLMLDRTFLKTGGYDPKKPALLKAKGAWFSDELKFWYVAPGKDEARAECLKSWPEHALSYRELQTLLRKIFNWSDE